MDADKTSRRTVLECMVWAGAGWARSGFGPITDDTTMRIMIPSLTAVTVGVQLAASGFLASVFTLRR